MKGENDGKEGRIESGMAANGKPLRELKISSQEPEIELPETDENYEKEISDDEADGTE